MIKDIIKSNQCAQAGGKELAALKAFFPQCFTSADEFDIEVFKSALPGGLKITDEATGFNFLGKNYARMLANMDTTTVISPDTEHNDKPENRDSENVYITGNNLDALQHLVKSYAGRIKVIYIDPPYNTGTDGFVYNDKFDFTSATLAEKLGTTEEKAARILNMTKRGSASHAAWLTFMLPRLSIARDLLTKDGVIFISIDDNEQANLKELCDEIFGEENFVSQFIWEKRVNRENRSETSVRHDYVLCYSKYFVDDSQRRLSQLPMNVKALANYSNPDDDPRGPWKSDPAHAQGGHGTSSQFYELIAPNGKKHVLPSGRCWIYNKTDMQKAIDDNRIWFGKDGNGVPRVKTYLYAKERGLTPETIIFAKDGSTNEKAKNELKDLFDGVSVFETPKPVELVKYLLNMSVTPGSIVVDFFSGSATTAHAVMQKNISDNTNIKYILVQLPEPCKEDSEAFKAGFKTIDQIGMERIKRSAKKIHDDNPLFAGNLGFKHFTLREPSADTLDKLEFFDPQTTFGSNLYEEFGTETILTTWLVADGYGLTAKATPLSLAGYTAYYKDDHVYLINSDDSFDENSIIALLDKYNNERFSPQNIILFGYSFSAKNRLDLEKSLNTLKDSKKNLQINYEVRY